MAEKQSKLGGFSSRYLVETSYGAEHLNSRTMALLLMVQKSQGEPPAMQKTLYWVWFQIFSIFTLIWGRFPF